MPSSAPSSWMGKDETKESADYLGTCMAFKRSRAGLLLAVFDLSSKKGALMNGVNKIGLSPLDMFLLMALQFP